MDETPGSRASAAHAARLERTVKDLQNRVKEQEEALRKLRLSSRPTTIEPSCEPKTRLQQLRSLSTAYDSLTPREPYLPSPDSSLPSLIALRATHKVIQDTQISITQTQVALSKVEERLDKEQADLHDANLITKSLERRINVLRGEIRDRTQKPPSQVARDMINELKKKKATYDSDTGKMVKAFNKFVDDHLATMLAIEELGGPVVGQILDVDHFNLQSEFNQGPMKKSKGFGDEDSRQRRIDEIWGRIASSDSKGKEPRDGKHAAAAEMRELTEQLLNNLVEADGGGGDPYVELERESAVVRYLVRSKVAQFHPKDSRRLKLVDFGRDLDD